MYIADAEKMKDALCRRKAAFGSLNGFAYTPGAACKLHREYASDAAAPLIRHQIHAAGKRCVIGKPFSEKIHGEIGIFKKRIRHSISPFVV